MPLLALWSSNPNAISEFKIEQVVATAGDGNLRDGSPCSDEFRAYLAEAPTPKLETYIEQCLDGPLTKGGYILQDLINEIGRRIEYKVTNGRYQGVPGKIGFDGIWISPEGHTLITEVKTSDAYRISLDTVARYRQELLAAGIISEPSSILIVVGRQDTGELEAQVRGSRHAWDIRLISADALIKLANLNQSVEGQETGKKIRTLLIPREYTRLDDMIDVMFTAAKDVETATESEALVPDEIDQASPEDEAEAKGTWEFTDRAVLQAKRDGIINVVGKREGAALIRKSPALYWNSSHDVRVACTISKRYTRSSGPRYWYAYHPQWDEFLVEAPRGYLVLGCVDLNVAFVIPRNELIKVLPKLNQSVKDNGSHYWHIHLNDTQNGFVMLLKQGETVDIRKYQVTLD
jgi:hypothetical protein